MGYARKDLEKTKKIAKKFVRYQEGAELYIWHRQEKICGAESCGKVNHRDVQTGDMYILIQILSEDVNMFMRKTL